jgi:chemotaxis signal transduction protein
MERYRIPLEAMLATEPEEVDGGRAVLVFESAGGLYAVDAASVELIAGPRFVAPLPDAPAELLGVASVRGRMRLVVNVSKGRSNATRLVVLHGDAQLALAADHVHGVVEEAPPDARILDPELLLDS